MASGFTTDFSPDAPVSRNPEAVQVVKSTFGTSKFVRITYLYFNTCTALGCLETGVSGCSKFPVIHQNGVRFHNRFAFHEDYGLPTIEEEAEALGVIQQLRGNDFAHFRPPTFRPLA